MAYPKKSSPKLKRELLSRRHLKADQEGRKMGNERQIERLRALKNAFIFLASGLLIGVGGNLLTSLILFSDERPSERLYDAASDYRIKGFDGILNTTSDALYLKHPESKSAIEQAVRFRRTADSENLGCPDKNLRQVEQWEKDKGNTSSDTFSHLRALQGSTCLKSGHFETAVALFEEAVNLQSNNWEALEALRQALLAREKSLRSKGSALESDEQELRGHIEETNELRERIEEIETMLSLLSAPRTVTLSPLHGLDAEPFRIKLSVTSGAGLRKAAQVDLPNIVHRDEAGRRAIIFGSADNPARPFWSISRLGQFQSDHVLGGELQLTHADGQRIGQALAQLGYRVDDVNGDRQRLLKALAIEARNSRATDELVVYFSGHGFTDAAGTPVIAVNGTDGLVTVPEITAVLSHHRGEVTLVLDACRDVRPAVTIKTEAVAAGINPPTILWATGPGDVAIESDRLGASVFTTALQRHLERQAAKIAKTPKSENTSGNRDGICCDGSDVTRFISGGISDSESGGAYCSANSGTSSSGVLRYHQEESGACGLGVQCGRHQLPADDPYGELLDQRGDLYITVNDRDDQIDDLRGDGQGSRVRSGTGGDQCEALKACNTSQHADQAANPDPHLDLAKAFPKIAMETERLARDLHGVEQTPELIRNP